MNRYHASDYEDDDALLNASLSEAEPDDRPLAGDDELRSTRIAEYLHEALRKDDPLRANLGALNAGLIGFASQSEAALKNSLHAGGGNVLENPHIQKAMGVHLILLRQIDRNLAIGRARYRAPS